MGQLPPLQHECFAAAGGHTHLSHVPAWQQVHWQLSQAQTPVSQQPQHAQLVPHEQPPLDLAVGSDANVARLSNANAATETMETTNLFME